MTSSPHGPDAQGYTRATMGRTVGGDRATGSKSVNLVSVRIGVQLDFMKAESLVIADQHAAVNTFPGLVHTARHTTKVDGTRSR